MAVKIKLKGSGGNVRKASDKKISLAKAAVAAYEKERAEYDAMLENFQEEFPEAAAALERIHEQQDVVENAIADAIPKLREAKTTVGDFKVVRAYKEAGYNDKKLTEIFGRDENGVNLFYELAENALIDNVKTNRAGVVAFMAQNPEHEALVKTAWEERAEQTPKVTAPKL